MASHEDVHLAGVYRGVVTNNEDPLQQLRVKLLVPQLFGDDETDWALPSIPLGLSQLPEPQTVVWVMFEGGDPSFPVWFGTWIASGTPVLLTGEGGAPIVDIPPGSITEADLADFSVSIVKYADSTHHYDRPTLTNNSPSAGNIAWASFSLVYKSVTYTVTAGHTANAYVYWLYNGGSPSVATSNTLPSLTTDDLLLFLNDNGIAANAQLAQALSGSLITPESILAGSIAANTITASQIAAGSIGTTSLAANSITATQLAAGAINGQTITGATVIGGLIETGTSGSRVTLDAAGAGPDRINFYAGTGFAGEMPMVMYASYDATDGIYSSFIRSALDTAHTSATYIGLQSSTTNPTGQATLVLQADGNANTAGAGVIWLSGHVQIGNGEPHGTNYVNVIRTATQSVAATTWSTMNFGTVNNTVADDGTIFAATNQFQSQAAGQYTGKFLVSWAASTTGNRMVRWITQGGSILAQGFLDMSSQLVTVTHECHFNDYLPGGGYYVQAQVFSSTSTNTVGNSGSTPLAASFVQVA